MFIVGASIIEAYTFIDAETGENTVIDSQGLRAWCLAHPELEIYNTPVEKEIAESFITENAIYIPHVGEVARMKSLDPVIYCKSGTFTNNAPDVMLADGHHRYYLAASLGRSTIPGYVLEVEQWKPFQLHGMPKQTREQLRDAPTRHTLGGRK